MYVHARTVRAYQIANIAVQELAVYHSALHVRPRSNGTRLSNR
jgi:hypothetical protein